MHFTFIAMQEQSDFDVHIALQVPNLEKLHQMLKKGKEQGIDVRGPSDHGFVHSIYFRDPNGYVLELTTPVRDAKAHFSESKAVAKQRVLEFSSKHSKSKL
jgi:catechol-2,3-dioxygenase